MKVKTSQLQKLIKQELPQESSTVNFSWINEVAINIIPREISPFKVNDKKILEFFAAYDKLRGSSEIIYNYLSTNSNYFVKNI
jgi:hypothetical protein